MTYGRLLDLALESAVKHMITAEKQMRTTDNDQAVEVFRDSYKFAKEEIEKIDRLRDNLALMGYSEGAL